MSEWLQYIGKIRKKKGLLALFTNVMFASTCTLDYSEHTRIQVL